MGLHDPLRLNDRAYAVIFILLSGLAALPVLLCETLPLVDYSNHLARMHILATLKDSVQLQKFYEIAWQPLPNLAMDLVVPPLIGWLPIAWAGKAFVVATLCLLSGGAAMVHRALFGTWSAWPLLAFLLLYDSALLWGFLNYLFGVGLSLVAFSCWIGLASRPWLRLSLGAVFALALFFSHLLAFGLYGVMALGYEAGSVLRRRLPPVQAAGAILAAAAPFLPPTAIYAFLTPKGAAADIAYQPLIYKLSNFVLIFGIENFAFDLTCFVIAALAIMLAVSRGWVRFHPAMAMPLGLLLLAYLVMPHQLATASGAERRVPLVLVLLLIAGSRWSAPTPGTARAFLAAALLLFLVRLGVMTSGWLESDRLYAQLMPAFDKVPAGSRVAIANRLDALIFPPTTLVHFPAQAVIRRNAFVPTLFAYPTQQPIALRPDLAALADRLPPWRLWNAFVERTDPLDGAERAALADYDFVIFLGRGPFALPKSSEVSAVFTAPRFVLAQVNAVSARSSSIRDAAYLAPADGLARLSLRGP
jgi:hypothetical protein